MTDPVEIMNEFTMYDPSKGEVILPLPIPGHWFRKICALADRIAAAENTVSAQAVKIKKLSRKYTTARAQISELEQIVSGLNIEIAELRGEWNK
jgi:hypothetical protein